MKIMGSFKLNEKPEEDLRIQLVEKMVSLGFPKAFISIEKQLDQLPNVADLQPPKRRIDILAYRETQGVLTPFFMIECKAVPLQQKHLQQVLGYNSFVQAPFVALANFDQFLWLSLHTKKFYYHIPSFFDLLQLLETAQNNF